MDKQENTSTETRRFSCDRAEFILLPCAVCMGYLFIRLIFFVGMGLSVVLFFAGVYATVFLYMRAAHIRPSLRGSSLGWTVLTLLLILSFVLLDGGISRQFPVLFATFCVCAIQIYTMMGCRHPASAGEDAPRDWGSAVFVMPFVNLGAFWQTLGESLRRNRGRTAIGVAIGFVCGLPLLIFLGFLLMRADGAFEALADRLGGEGLESFFTLLRRVLAGLPFAMMAFGILYGARSGRRIYQGRAAARFIPVSAACGLLIPVVLLYTAYLVTQLAYFFSAFSGLLPEGYTYSDYARRGFFELCAVCAVNLTLIVLIVRFVRGSSSGSMTRSMRFFIVFLALFSLLLSGTAAAKMILYVRVYGLTPARLRTMWFMLALALTLVFALIRTFRPRFPLARVLAVTLSAMLLAYAYTDADVLSVRYNLAAIERGALEADITEASPDECTFARFDAWTLEGMSDGIVPLLRAHPSEFTEYILSHRENGDALSWTLAGTR